MIGKKCWKQLVKKMPIPCVDTIVWRDREFLMGWRTIPPYKNLWALLGEKWLAENHSLKPQYDSAERAD